MAAPGEGRSVDGRLVVSSSRLWPGLLILVPFAFSLVWQARTGTNAYVHTRIGATQQQGKP